MVEKMERRTVSPEVRFACWPQIILCAPDGSWLNVGKKQPKRCGRCLVFTLVLKGDVNYVVVSAAQSCKRGAEPAITVRPMRPWVSLLLVSLLSAGSAAAQEDKKTDDLKPADPDTGESTVEETTLGLLPLRLDAAGGGVGPSGLVPS